MRYRPRRSALYMPASNARAIEKARGLPCDVVILDLEDAVAPDAKPLAREKAVEAVQAGGFGRREVVIRCNGLDTPWGAEDLAAAARAGPDAVLVPKVGGPADIAAYEAALQAAPEHTALWAMIETTRSLFQLDAIAGLGATTRLGALCLGLNDLAREMGARQTADRAPFWSALSLSVAAARTHGLVVLDSVFNAIGDDAALEQVCRQGADFGFDGKTLIHPSHLDICNRIFSPDAVALKWARAVIEAYERPENAAKGALQVGGRLAERLHLQQSLRLVSLADSIADAETP